MTTALPVASLDIGPRNVLIVMAAEVVEEMEVAIATVALATVVEMFATPVESLAMLLVIVKRM